MPARPIVALLFLLASLPAAAFNCGQRLVHEGDSRYDVRNKCGEPADIETHSIYRQPVVWYYGRPVLAKQADATAALRRRLSRRHRDARLRLRQVAPPSVAQQTAVAITSAMQSRL